MDENVKVAISESFFESFAALPKQIQGKVRDFFYKFRANPNSPGINYEKLNVGQDKKIWSVRIDQTYRGIVVRQPETGVYLLLWVDHHDEAYAWAKNKKCEVNSETGAIQIFEMVSAQEEKNAKENNTGINYSSSDRNADSQSGIKDNDPGNAFSCGDSCLFESVSDQDLIELGLPAELLPFIHGIASKQELIEHESRFSPDMFEALSWLAEGIPVDEVRELVGVDDGSLSGNDNLAAALDNIETKSTFVVIEGEEELRHMLEAPLDKWRVFLHPTQRKIVDDNYSGPARVLGGAGTGKTVVGMHRAKKLAHQLKGREKVLFTTFTANLASDIQDKLKKICTREELSHIDVINIDALVARFLREQGVDISLVYNDKLTGIWKEIVYENDSSGEFLVSFYEDEYNRVIAGQEAYSLEKYMKASRNGRGTRLDRRKRIQVWKVFEAYQKYMQEKKIRDVNTAMYECCELIAESESKSRYKHIIVDEGQDLSASAFRFLRAIGGDEHENDIFIVGDAHQRIYKNRAVLSKCGINIRGRSKVLHINYRTTDEIRRVADALLEGVSFDDLDGGFDNGNHCQSLIHGQKPRVMCFTDANEEFENVQAEIQKLINEGVPAKDICVVARTRRLVEEYYGKFTNAGIRCYEIKKSKTDDRGLDGIRIATMHRVKGLEFQYIFVVSANNKIIPLSSAIDNTDAVSVKETTTAEKCLLYVALTRAQKGVFISGYGNLSEFIEINDDK